MLAHLQGMRMNSSGLCVVQTSCACPFRRERGQPRADLGQLDDPCKSCPLRSKRNRSGGSSPLLSINYVKHQAMSFLQVISPPIPSTRTPLSPFYRSEAQA